jgi:aryl-alcohol dehydrogenase-like predicted oxidoreductase
MERLGENIAAAAIDLTPDDLKEIDETASAIKVVGDRYPEEFMKLSGR